MAIRQNITADEMQKNALSNNTPSEFQEVLELLNNLWADALIPSSSIAKRTKIYSRRTTGARRYFYPVGVPFWGSALKTVFTDTETVFTISSGLYNRLMGYQPSQDWSSYSTTQIASFRNYSYSLSSSLPPSLKGFSWVYCASDTVTDTATINNIYQGGNVFCAYTSITPPRNNAYPTALTTSISDTSKKNFCGVPRFAADDILSGGVVSCAKIFFEKLLLTPLHLWLHTCEPQSSVNYTAPLNIYATNSSSYTAPEGFIRDSVITMPHYIPYREGAPDWCNVLNIAIWETDAFRDSAYDYGDFRLIVEIAGVGYEARVKEAAAVTINGVTERGIFCQVQAPQGIAGSFVEGGRRFWPVKINAYGRPRALKKGNVPASWHNQCIGSISAWLGGEMAKEDIF